MPPAKKPRQSKPRQTTTRKAATAPDPTIFVATSTGVVKVDGQLVHYYAGTTRVRAGHPLLDAARGKFEPMKLDYDVEDATNAPGRKRGQ